MLSCSDARHGVLCGECVDLSSEFGYFGVGLHNWVEFDKLLSMALLDAFRDSDSFDQVADDLDHLGFLHPTGRRGWGSQSNATWVDGAEENRREIIGKR